MRLYGLEMRKTLLVSSRHWEGATITNNTKTYEIGGKVSERICDSQ